MKTAFQSEDYVLRWPLDLFRSRLSELINDHLRSRDDGPGSWSDQVELLLDDAFESGQPLDAFRAAHSKLNYGSWGANPSTNDPPGRRFLIDLLRGADLLPQEVRRRPYRSQRGQSSSTGSASISTSTLVTRFINLVDNLQERGYFERSFGKDCVDDPAGIDPAALIDEEIGVSDAWPLSVDRLVADQELFLDLIEVLGEFVAAPRGRWFHSFGDCGWHHREFNLEQGRDLYFWLINRLLVRTPLALQIATSGEDRGRLIEVHGDARNDLVTKTLEAASGSVHDPVQHAVALFRRRGASVEEKRSACVALAGVLESRRALIRENLLRRDEGALFQIANEFNIRHRAESQKAEYDPVFLDWIFWWYLGTIELTERVLARQNN